MMEKRYKQNKYPNGYIPKLQYWTTKLTEELNKENPNLTEIDRIHGKLDWFIQKEWDRTIIVKTK
jgi:hypothetical protein